MNACLKRSKSRCGERLVCGTAFASLLLGAHLYAGSTAAVATDVSRPVTVKVSLLNGSIKVETHPQNEVRAETDGGSVSIAQAGNDVTVQSAPGRPADLHLKVPLRTSLQLKSVTGGNILVEGVEGSIEAETANASITLQKITGVVVVNSLQGRLRVQMDKVEPGKPMSFTTMNGDIELSLPADTAANLKLQTLTGSIRCDFPVTLDGTTSPASPRGRVSGTINGGGPEYQLKTLNGSIDIKKNSGASKD